MAPGIEPETSTAAAHTHTKDKLHKDICSAKYYVYSKAFMNTQGFI